MNDLLKKVHELFDIYHAPAHDIKHVLRTSNLAKQIALAEGYDAREAEIAGLLHDMGRTVKNPQKSHAHEGVPIARELLNTYTDFTPDAKERILQSIEHHSDRHTEGKLNNIVQDADKLDGMGALGIARAYVSHSHLPDFDQNDICPKPGDYYNIRTVHELISLEMEWYSMLYTEKAKALGKPRYEFMKQFMQEITREVKESS